MPDQRFEPYAPPRSALSARYVVERELGYGATARVFLARDTKHDRLVALKILRPELARSVGAERFLREIRVAAGLQHPNILALYDSGEIDDSLFFVMPYMEGETLRERMNRGGPYSLADAIAVVREIADALSYAHERGVVHRDVKPENVFLAGGHAFIGDFGIAHAVTYATHDRLTASGLAVGTPFYMSPEQALGEESVDGRSDQYSLACMFFEMLTSHPPFSGTTPRQLIAQQVRHRPKRVRSYRKDVPRGVDAALGRALSAEPAHRFATTRQFAEAIERAGAAASPGAWRQRIISWAAGAATVAVMAIALNWIFKPPTPPLDPTLYAVLPFEHDSAAATGLAGDNCQLLLSNAFSQWRGMRLVDQMRTNSAYAQAAGSHAPTLESVLDAARAVHAGTAAWGSVHLVSDTLYVRASLYDVASGESIREFRVGVPRALTGLSEQFQRLADSLLLHVAGAPTTADAMGTRSLEAWRAYVEGHRALAQWDLASARRHFARATELDPDYPQAWLWTVQATSWAGTFPRARWRDAAARLASLRGRLGPADQEFALALLNLAEAQFPEACERYRALLATDSLSFRAWFGLGECQSLDRLVIPHRLSPSGWRFRASHHGAIEAYRRALSLTPASQMAFRGRSYDRLQAMFWTSFGAIKQGYAVSSGDTTRFAAFASLDRDTLVFVPRPTAEVISPNFVWPATLGAAIARNRRAMLDVTTSWASAFPTSADALESNAHALEGVEALVPSPTSPVNALAAYRRALGLSRDARQRVELGRGIVRVLMKVGRYEEAGRLADSIATARPSDNDDVESVRAPMAALVGRIRLAMSGAARGAAKHTVFLPTSREVSPPISLGAATLRMNVYSAFGGNPDTLRALFQSVQNELDRWSPPAEKQALRAAIFEGPATVAFDILGPSEFHERPTWLVTEVQQMAIRGPRAALIARLDSLAADTGPISAETAYHLARIALGVADTTHAKAFLDQYLRQFPGADDRVLNDAPNVAPIPRLMALRAELALTGERAEARRWANAVLSLWRRPDPELVPVVHRMRQIRDGA